MKDFLQYIYNEVKDKRLGKTDALDLLHQFQSRNFQNEVYLSHPLLHQNTSDFSEQRYRSTFSGEEFFLADHVINGHRVLPGVVYLEMALAAVEMATGIVDTDAGRKKQVGICFKNMVWARPIRMGKESIQVHIGLYPESDGEISYEIYSEPKDENTQSLVHSQGRVVLGPLVTCPSLDIKDLKDQCNQSTLSATRYYEVFNEMGIAYGASHRGVEMVYVGRGQVLAKLSLPDSVCDTKDQFTLHPSIMDAALQASLGLEMGENGGKPPSKAALPFALQEMEIFKPCTVSMWALARCSAGSKIGDKIQKIDIDLCDDQGNVCVRLKGFTSRVIEEGEKVSNCGALVLKPSYVEQDVGIESEGEQYARHVVMLCGLGDAESIEGQMEGVHCISLQTEYKEIDKRFQAYVVEVFKMIRSILKDKSKGRILLQLVVSNNGEQMLLGGLSGLLKTAQIENPNLVTQFIEVDPIVNSKEIVEILEENSRSPKDNRICYKEAKRLVEDWSEIEHDKNIVTIPWNDTGVYIITGGMGGLGYIFAQEIAREVRDAVVILTGRSLMDHEKQIRLNELVSLGIKAEYRTVDVSDKEAVCELVESVRDFYGKLDGIIHSAGVIKDSFIIKKTEDELYEVMAPKVTGVVNLDEATKDLGLEFFVYFSSFAGSMGSLGQSDYSAANAFMDAYAKYRNGLVALKQRRGKTLSINWPLWKNGGMSVEKSIEKMMIQNTGIVPMETETGINALYLGFASGENQVMVIEGDVNQMKQKVLGKTPQSLVSKAIVVSENNSTIIENNSSIIANNTSLEVDEELLQEKALNYFKKLISPVIKLPANQIEGDAPLEEYGIDSIIVMELTNELEKTFGSLSKTLFFEYQNLQNLTEYFLESYHDQLLEQLGMKETQKETELAVEVKQPTVEAEELLPAKWSQKRPRFAFQSEIQHEKVAENMDIAIIGVAGRYPEAKNITEFWNNLKDGKDSITEIPLNRWDHSLYFDEDRNKPGKTYSKWGGFLEVVDKFDPLFFNISPREAEIMDPQERLFLECVYETLEDSGYTRQALNTCNVGVFVGVMYEEYQLYGAQKQIQGNPVSLGNNPSSIANRVSYFCNFQGPSMAVDTMCSSSLTAIHLAYHNIQRGECEVAIAGGVNVSVHPNKYLMLAQGKFASSKGRCESFGLGGDGYVPGEGVGAVLLKSLSKAILDGDHIYGIIKGTAVNHGGKTNGYTVPNPNAQSEVIGKAIKEAGIDPRTISYIEAHGTGTSLGDPIEIGGLTKIFREYTQDKQFCAIGSAKSNIGHCESAAGIAGLTKVLLQMKYGQLAPSLHSKVLNPNIDFNNSPFVVQQTLTTWERPVVTQNGESQEYPRRAGISSFGAGGGNAHLVIEEYVAQSEEQIHNTISQQNPAVIVLSAKNEERLKERIQQLLDIVQEGELSDKDLSNLAYTLQVGREAMEERLALLVVSIKELEDKLTAFLAGQEYIEDLYYGQVKRNKEALVVFTADEDLKKAIDSWIIKGKYTKLIALWVKGLAFDWNKLYNESKPKRISLPTYPFANERYWVPDGVPNDNRSSIVINNLIHPLLHSNTSDLSEQRYSTTFTGEEFFLTDHVVKGQKVLPGVASLEMARVAVEKAVADLTGEQRTIWLKNMVWVHPIVIGQKPIQVHIGLYPEEDGEVEYEIYGYNDVDSDEVVVYSQGRALFVMDTDNPVWNLEAIKLECSQRSLLATEVYQKFKEIGIAYGPSHQGVEKIYVGTNQVLAKLSMPDSVYNTKDQFILHPSMMDSALQASLGLEIGDKVDDVQVKPALPFALQELEIFSPCTTIMWALVHASDSSKIGDKIQKINIDLCDNQGNVCVRLKGFTSRVLEGESEGKLSTRGSMLLEPVWKEQSVSQVDGVSDHVQQVVILCGLESDQGEEISPETIKAGMKEVQCFQLQSKEKGIAKRFQSYSIQVFEEIKKILKDKNAGKTLVQIVVPNHGEEQLFSSLSGLLKTAYGENPKLIGQIIEVNYQTETTTELILKLKENSYDDTACQIRYEDGKRLVADWSELKELVVTDLPWKEDGVYLITGGAGGLGLIFAKEIISQAKGARLILTGRSELNETKQTRINDLTIEKSNVTYCQVDVTDSKAVSDLIQNIHEEYGSLDGIIHSAGVIRDSYIIKKTKEEIEEVLAPKVSGLVNLDEASKETELDFFICFSSISGSLGGAGQADYSIANAFMDTYAKYRNGLVALKQRSGKMLSLNWPLWKDGGMGIEKAFEEMMTKNTGMVSMETETGIRALYRSLSSGADQVMVMEGDLEQIKQKVLGIIPPSASQEMPEIKNNTDVVIEKPMLAIEEELFQEKVLNYFKKQLSPVIKLPAERIEVDTLMEEYGIDSVMVMELTNQLERTFGSLSKTLFFEYQTIRELSEYFINSYQEKLNELIGIEKKVKVSGETTVKNVSKPVSSVVRSRNRQRFTIQQPVHESKTNKPLDVAIIGVSGRYPQAQNLDEFWNNLKDGKDCITEIPKERWDHSQYFDEDKNKFGKTYSKWGGFIDGVDQFDPLFFNISPREAEIMDPQERLFLECVYETIEEAGYTKETLSKYQRSGLEGNVGVYVGVMYEEYQLYGAQAQVQGYPITLSGTPSSIANRVSYFFNFHGPSVALDTMCSSSLTSIHMACQDIQNGKCDLAIAGGVNVSIHPNKYIMLAQGKFVSSKGRCESFGLGGDGYVPGEGVGAILLKPLEKAIADGDHIYGVVKGTAINHGGKTNGYTVPNPNAQAGVIEEALQESGIDSRTISYIEAHGTGTSLGDPIEITGLVKAFEKHTDNKQFCTIGSAKSNIGHCESAAGIAGVTKVLLQLKYQQLVPSLHSEVLNPNIDFPNTPFTVQQELKEWKRPVITEDGVSKEYPRIAGISGFGAGGSNAHVIIEEYIHLDEKVEMVDEETYQTSAIIVLSAKNKERLKEYAQRLLTAIKERQFTDANISDVAYTLQVGREAMEERLGIIVSTIKELEDKLKAFLAGQNHIENLYYGQIKQNKDALAVFIADEDMQKAIDSWIVKEKYTKLIDIWVKGFAFDWNKLYIESKPRRISLPTYPFAKERYWVPEAEQGAYSTITAMNDFIHPLLHRNTSKLSEQRYSTVFTGKEFFLTDHVMEGQKVLPGAVCLEMARAAVEEAVDDLIEEQSTILLKNIVWIRPVEVAQHPIQVHIGLYPEENGEIEYEIYGNNKAGSKEKVVYSQGRAVLVPVEENPVWDIGAIQVECAERSLSSNELYQEFKEMGIAYGPSHKGVEKISMGTGQILAKLSMPDSVYGTKEQFILHPSMIDAALQASLGLEIGENVGNSSIKPALPFALQELKIVKPCMASMWAVIRGSDNSKIGDRIQKIDIDLCDEQGNVCVQLKGFSSRVQADREKVSKFSTLMLKPCYTEKVVSLISNEAQYEHHIVMLCGIGDADSIGVSMEGTHCIALQTEGKKIDKWFQNYTVEVFGVIKNILKDKIKDRVLIQLVVPNKGKQMLSVGLAGLLKTAQIENPKLVVQLIEVDPSDNSKEIVKILEENRHSPKDHRIRYQDGSRLVEYWSEIEHNKNAETIPWKKQGVYIITGGMGGLGYIFAKEIVREVKDAVIVLLGRSLMDHEKQRRLKELMNLGARVEYRTVDVSDKKAVCELIESVKDFYGSLDGIIHSAGVIKDNFIIKKNEDELCEVMSPKVSGLVNLDEASMEIELDFFICFSSVSGSMGGAGQADYSTANAFMDAYAKYRNELVALKQRSGKTISINWPLWKEGGMGIEKVFEEKMTQNTGMVPMETATGIEALYRSFTSDAEQVMVLEGDLERMKQKVLGITPSSSTSEAITVTKKLPSGVADKPMVAIEELFQEKVLNYFKKQLSPVIKLPANRIEVDTPMEEYGIDSVMVMELTDQLEKTFGSLSKTLFFEYQTIQELSEYFLKAHNEKLNQLIGIEKKEKITGETIVTNMLEPESPVVRGRKRQRFTIQQSVQESETNKSLDVAIIGVSGRYPQAQNLDEFWNNLKDGKDCITEIPKERWDHSQYFDEDKNKFGKAYSKWGGFIDGVDQFDPLFFNISPREAELMDPQERLFLECVYETLEEAGYTKETLSKYQRSGLEGNVGVYVGVMYEEYQLYGAQAQVQGYPITLSGNPSSIANRVSYFFNFHGPSVALDTMCSSSLTSIHMACQDIQYGKCELAIAGGVNVSIHPNKYIMLSQGNFVSSKGRCESFGLGGDGYVPGEGVGAILLKPLTKAIADGDHIYGVIKGTAINHGGKTNGYTVPNPNAQAGVIEGALQESGIDPRTISYIEAHGTGTSLGDPIEITGLTKTFNKYTQEKQFCAIGSAKSNIGHCESAAGIAGVTKVLLQMKYKQLVPSLHSKVLNANIDFSDTPFVVQQNLEKWKRPVIMQNGKSREYPRRAGISAFGAGGSNAHVVIEEYIAQNEVNSHNTISKQNPAIIVLSAKDDERLQERVQQLLKVIKEKEFSDENLVDLAYTLQVGREAMEERLAMPVASMKELEDKLKKIMEDQDEIEDLYRGCIKNNRDIIRVFTGDEELYKAIDSWLVKGKYTKLINMWVKGVTFDWNKLYGESKPRRISLPTYPFAKECYWVPEGEMEGNRISVIINDLIHPLLHRNTSDVLELRYSTTFTGKEFFLTDHIVKGQKVLPGVISLEMARAAVEAAASHLSESPVRIQLIDVVWAMPIVVDKEPVKVNIILDPEDNGDIEYKIYCESEKDGVFELHSQGRAMLIATGEKPTLNLEAIQTECNERYLSAVEAYKLYNMMGIKYGPAHRGIEEIYVGYDQVLAKLSLPSSVAGTENQYMLHPSIIDAALQASIGLNSTIETNSDQSNKPMLPFALQEVEVLRESTSIMWAWIRYSEPGKDSNKIQKLDIDLCDEEGNVAVRLKGFSARAKEEDIQNSYKMQTVLDESIPNVLEGINKLVPVWETISIEPVELYPSHNDHIVMIGGTQENKKEIQNQYPNTTILDIKAEDSIEEIIKKFEVQESIDHILWITPPQLLQTLANEEVIKGQSQGVIRVFRVIKALLSLGYETSELGWSFITFGTQPVNNNELVDPAHASLHGLVGSMAKEYPNWKIRLVDLEFNKDWSISTIFTLPIDPEGNPVSYRDGEWYQQKLILARDNPVKETLYKTGGVYVVIGGAGGIGETWSEYMIKTYQAKVIWIGRREKDEAIQEKIHRLATYGPEPQYIAADATNREALEKAYQEIKQQYSEINGIIHSAIVLLDKSLMNMEEEQFKAGLSAKVDVSVRIAQVFYNEPLDFVLFFSSMQSFSKPAGQSNYASGCVFKDIFAHRLSQELFCPVKVINWGYWGNIGIVASNAYRKRMAQAGIGSIEPPEAMEALETLLVGSPRQIALMKTTKPLTIDGINPEKLITIYSEKVPSMIGNMIEKISTCL